MTITGLEPAGGCTARVSIIKAMAAPTANAMLHHCEPNAAKQINPVSDDKKCPTITLRGCEKGLSGKPKTNTQVAPNDPKIKGVAANWLKLATTAMAKIPPNPARAIRCKLARGGHAAPPRIFDR